MGLRPFDPLLFSNESGFFPKSMSEMLGSRLGVFREERGLSGR